MRRTAFEIGWMRRAIRETVIRTGAERTQDQQGQRAVQQFTLRRPG
jgi:hypothetical protein